MSRAAEVKPANLPNDGVYIIDFWFGAWMRCAFLNRAKIGS